MHVLTKIFVVLVSLLACMLVPLVVTYAHNENSYASLYSAAKSQADAAEAELRSARSGFDTAKATLQTENTQLQETVKDLRSQMASLELDVRQAEQGRVEAESRQSEFQAQLATLASAIQVGQSVRETLLSEVRDLRDRMLDTERERVELDQAYQLALSEKEVAEKARRALEEELAQIKDERSSALDQVQRYVSTYGPLDAGDSVQLGVRPDRNLETRIVEVRRTADEVLAEIDAGSRDGVKIGWVLTISNAEGFAGRLRVTEVDINRAVGVVELEQGRVAQGDRVLARSRG